MMNIVDSRLAEGREDFEMGETIKQAIAERWRAYREARASVCRACGGWGEIGHGPENRGCHCCYDGIVRGESWGQLLDSLIEAALHRVGIEGDEAW